MPFLPIRAHLTLLHHVAVADGDAGQQINPAIVLHLRVVAQLLLLNHGVCPVIVTGVGKHGHGEVHIYLRLSLNVLVTVSSMKLKG